MELPEYGKTFMTTYKGTLLFSTCEIEDIQKMSIRDDDTWVISYPRSGTTLTQEIVYMLRTDLDIESSLKFPMDQRFPFLDLLLPDMPHFKGLKVIEEQTTPRLIKSHLHYHVLPPQLFQSKCKKIYVMRNPKDVVVSCFMLNKYLTQLDPDYSLEKYCREWNNHEHYATPWWLHVRDFWLHRSDPNILILRYEDIVTDIPTTIRQIADHLNIAVTPDAIENIANHCQFNNMKKNASTNGNWQEEFKACNTEFGGHVRKGKIGGWREHLTADDSREIDAMVQDKLADIDLNFNYGQ